MKSNVYATYDTCAGIYSKPFTAQSDNEVVRSFGDIVKDKTHPIGQHPEHYSVWRIGSFNDQDAKLIPDNPKECLITAMEVAALADAPVTEHQVPEHPDLIDLNHDPRN